MTRVRGGRAGRPGHYSRVRVPPVPRLGFLLHRRGTRSIPFIAPTACFPPLLRCTSHRLPAFPPSYTALADEASILSGLAKATAGVREAGDVDEAQRERAGIEKRLRDLEEKVGVGAVGVKGRRRDAGGARNLEEGTWEGLGRRQRGALACACNLARVLSGALRWAHWLGTGRGKGALAAGVWRALLELRPCA